MINECARNNLAIRKNLPNVTSMTFEVILHLIEYLCLHDISILSIYSFNKIEFEQKRHQRKGKILNIKGPVLILYALRGHT